MKMDVPIVFVVLLAIAVLYTFPLAANLSWQFPGFEQSDTCLSIWNIWHLKRVVIEKHTPFVFTTDYIFYPQKPSLVLHNYMMASGLLSLPLQAFFTAHTSMNIIFFLGFILTGLGMYLLTLRCTGNKFAAAWASVTLAFCPYVIAQSCYFLHFSTIWFFPWFIFLTQRFIDSGRLKYSCLAALVYALCLLEDQTYFFLLTLVAAAMAIFWFMRRKKIKPEQTRQVRPCTMNLLIGAAVFLAVTFPYLSALLKETLSMGSSFPVWPDTAVDYFSLHLSQLLRPSSLLSVYRGFPALSLPVILPTNVFCGYIPLFFALYALIHLKDMAAERRAMIFFWGAVGLIFFFIALGPKPFGGNEFLNAVAPYRLIFRGILKQFRIPMRFSLVTMISLYIIASFGVAEFLRRNRQNLLRNASLFFFILALQVIEFLPLPYPLLDLTVPAKYYRLAKQDPGTPVLIIPLGWQSSYKTVGQYDKRVQVYQTVHGHPVFQGQIARIPDKYFDFYTDDPGFRYLMDASNRLPTPEEAERVLEILATYRIKHFLN